MRLSIRSAAVWFKSNSLSRLKRIAKSALHRYPRTVAVENASGRHLRFRVHSPVEEHRTKDFGGERIALQWFTGRLRPGDVVYDIGASVGLYTAFTAAALREGQVYSFEPDPAIRARLIQNVSMNQLDNVTIVPWAVGDREEEISLYTSGAAGFSPSLAYQEARAGAPKATVPVSMCSLDIALHRDVMRRPDVLKIDVEGAEELCLRGALGLLTGRFGQRPRMIFLELHPEFLGYFSSSAGDVERLLEHVGYEAVWTQGRDAERHTCYVPGRRFHQLEEKDEL